MLSGVLGSLYVTFVREARKADKVAAIASGTRSHSGSVACVPARGALICGRSVLCPPSKLAERPARSLLPF